MRLIRLSSVLSWFGLDDAAQGPDQAGGQPGYSTGSLVLHPPGTGKTWNWRWRPARLSSICRCRMTRLPDRLFGVPVVATVLEAAGVGHVLALPMRWSSTPTHMGVGGAVVGDIQRR